MGSRRKFLRYRVEEEVLGILKIKGRIYSKKNSNNIGIVKGKVKFFGNPAYNRSKDDYSEQLQASSADKPIQGPIAVTLVSYGNNERWVKQWQSGEKPDKYHGADVDNRLNSILDLLHYANVIVDDSQVITARTRKLFGKAPHDDYGAYLIITRFDPDTPWAGAAFFKEL